MFLHSRFRTINGTCNNLENRAQGAAFTPFRREEPAEYENGVNEPKGEEFYSVQEPEIHFTKPFSFVTNAEEKPLPNGSVKRTPIYL